MRSKNFMRAVLITLALASPSLVSAEVVGIKMTDNGFVPDTVVVHVGDTVIYMNEGKNPHWPASNIHPTHSVYPGSGIEKCGTQEQPGIFDACGGVAPGKTFAFTFNSPGEWRFHDHLNPSHAGSVKVEGETVAQENNSPSLWQRTKAFFASMIHGIARRLTPRSSAAEIAKIDMFALVKDHDSLVGAVRDYGAKPLMERLIQQSNGGAARDCHQEAHKLGRVSYEVNGKDAFRDGDSSCHSGFYHGAMESFLREHGTTNLAKSIIDVCSEFPTSFSKFECLHGVGHGLLAYEDYDLPKTLNDCKQLSDQFAISSCYGGVFMENIVTAQGWGATSDHSTNWVKRDDAQFPCTAVKDNPEALYQCYLMQTSWMLTISNYDFKWASKQCLQAPDTMIDVCYQSLGRDAAGFTLRDPQKIVDICDDVSTKYRYRCIVGAVNVIIDFWGEKLQGQASELCKIAKEGRHECYSTLASRLSELFTDPVAKARACVTLDPAYQQFCR